MEVHTDAEAIAARRAKRLAFGGRIDPHKHLRETPVAPALPRAGTPTTIAAPATVAATRREEPTPIRAEIPPLNHVEAARALKPLVERAGGTWSAELYQRTAARWPAGVPYDQVDAWAAELAASQRGGLRVVGGAA